MRGPSILFPRKILTEDEKYLDDSGIILLVGARQVGKTSILYLLIERLKKKGVPDSSIYYFDREKFCTDEGFFRERR